MKLFVDPTMNRFRLPEFPITCSTFSLEEL